MFETEDPPPPGADDGPPGVASDAEPTGDIDNGAPEAVDASHAAADAYDAGAYTADYYNYYYYQQAGAPAGRFAPTPIRASSTAAVAPHAARQPCMHTIQRYLLHCKPRGDPHHSHAQPAFAVKALGAPPN